MADAHSNETRVNIDGADLPATNGMEGAAIPVNGGEAGSPEENVHFKTDEAPAAVADEVKVRT